MLAIILGVLYSTGIDFKNKVSPSNASPSTDVASESERPSAAVTDSESETPTSEEETADSDPSDAPANELSPEALEGREVSELMNDYQLAWLQAMNDRSMEPLLPYVTKPDNAAEGNSVYNIVEAEIFGDLTPSGLRVGGLVRYLPESKESVIYELSEYKLFESVKVSEDRYKLRIEKRVRRDAAVLVNRKKPELGTYPPLTTYKETTYTYNVVREDEVWKIQSIDDATIPVCYADSSYTVIYERMDGKTLPSNGNCPGLAPSER